MEEVWKDIIGFEGFYEISSLGRVRSKDRAVRAHNGSRVIKGRIMRHSKKSLYPRVCLRVGTKKVTAKIHRLLAIAFIPNPQNHPVVNHMDGNKYNFKLDNLEWCTQSHNELHSWHVLGKKANPALKGVRRAACHFAKAVVVYTRDGEKVGEYPCAMDAADALGVCRSKISSVCRGKRNHTGGYVFRFANQPAIHKLNIDQQLKNKLFDELTDEYYRVNKMI